MSLTEGLVTKLGYAVRSVFVLVNISCLGRLEWACQCKFSGVCVLWVLVFLNNNVKMTNLEAEAALCGNFISMLCLYR